MEFYHSYDEGIYSNLRLHGPSPYTLGLVYNDGSDNLTYNVLVESDGTFIPAKADKSHASSTASTYGAGNASYFGHVKLSDNYTSSAGSASGSVGASSLAVYNAYNTLNTNKATYQHTGSSTTALIFYYGSTSSAYCQFRLSGSSSVGYALSLVYYTSSGTSTIHNLLDADGVFIEEKADKSHASTSASTYGAGTASYYGHVKLSDSYTSSGGNAAASVAASSYAVNQLWASSSSCYSCDMGTNVILNFTFYTTGGGFQFLISSFHGLYIVVVSTNQLRTAGTEGTFYSSSGYINCGRIWSNTNAAVSISDYSCIMESSSNNKFRAKITFSATLEGTRVLTMSQESAGGTLASATS